MLLPPIGCKQCGLFLFNCTKTQSHYCSRCNETLFIPVPQIRNKLIAISLTGFILLLTSFTLPFLSLYFNSFSHSIYLTDIILGLWQAGYKSIALLFCFTVIILPSLFYLACIGLCFAPKKYAIDLIKFVEKSTDWLLIDVLIVSILVSYTKMGAFGDLYFHPGFFTLFLSSTCLIYLQHLKQVHSLWFLLPTKNQQLRQPLHLCPICHHLNRDKQCKQCCHQIEPPQKKNQLHQCWAYLITAMILYIPANSLPMMITSQFGQDSGDTILSGIILLWNMHAYGIAIIIFIASIFIPLFKMVMLAWLYLTAGKGSAKQQSFWFKVTHVIGKWSFIDIFVIAILTALIQFGEVIHIAPGSASIAFTGVVIFTLLSAHQFNSALFFKLDSAIQPNDAF